MDRIGFYCWAGPGTIRMLDLKYFNPRIDTNSLLSSYDLDYLLKLKDTFGITDFWATYSWGFAEETEQEDSDFLLSRLDNFKRAGIKLHAYIQGTNLVYEDYPGKDWFCRNDRNQLIAYHRGRKVTCVNNPGFQDFIIQKLEKMSKLGFDGIYMDNMQMGQWGVITEYGELPENFAGCNCNYCQEKFRQETGGEIPLEFKANPELAREYLDFRCRCMTEFIEKAAEIVHKYNKEFGTNSFDPKFDTKYVYGVELTELDKYQDYLLFENHSLPADAAHSNEYIDQLMSKFTKPVFVLSYHREIGKDSQYPQIYFDKIYAEDKKLAFFSCIKGSEYCTDNEWHNLRLENYSQPDANVSLPKKVNIVQHKFLTVLLKAIPGKHLLIHRYYNSLYTLVMEHKSFRGGLNLIYSLVIR